MGRQVGACWVSGADPFLIFEAREQDSLCGGSDAMCAQPAGCQNFRVGDDVDQTGESAAVGERFEDKSDSRTHQDQRVEIHWTAELRWTEPSGTPDALEKR